MFEKDLIDDPQIEEFVIKQITGTMQKIFIDEQAYFYLIQQRAECDLIIEHNGKVKAAIEIKISLAPQNRK